MAQMVFERLEKKYRLNQAQYEMIRFQLRKWMREDAFGAYAVHNLYYDTADYALIRHSIDKPLYKEKLRLRTYGAAEEGRPIFLELKKKFQGVVYKRRIKLAPAQADSFLLDGRLPIGDDANHKEIECFLRRYDLSPRVYLGYDRIALAGIETPSLRITFDTRIRFLQEDLRLNANGGTLLMEPGQALMEIKSIGPYPLWLSRMLSQLLIFPTSFSKYGQCYQAHLAHRPAAGRREISA